MLRQQAWTVMCLERAREAARTAPADLWGAFGRALTCGRTVGGQHPPAALPDLMRRYCRSMAAGSLRDEPDAGSMVAVEAAVCGVMGGRRFFVTKEGRLGQASLAARVGDGFFVALGAQVPFVVRRTGTGAGGYEFVGECFLDGVMDGEALEGAGGEMQEIALV
jgi:hypothetical protein